MIKFLSVLTATLERKRCRAAWHYPAFFDIALATKMINVGTRLKNDRTKPRIGRFQHSWPRRRATYHRNEGQVFQGICQARFPLNRSPFVGVRSIRDGDLFVPRLFLYFHRTSLPLRAFSSVKHHRSSSSPRGSPFRAVGRAHRSRKIRANGTPPLCP